MKLIPNGVTRSIGRKVLLTKKNSPHIFFVGGVIGIVGAAYMACKATLKLEETVDEIKEEFVEVKGGQGAPHYTDQEYHRDLGLVYIRSVYKVGRLYGPSIFVGTVSVAALTGSHVQLVRRNAALTATLGAMSKAFDEYRSRVREELGEEREREIHLGVKDKLIEENGKKKTVKVADPDSWPIYSRMFDESNANWQPNTETNRFFLQANQNYANHLLTARGHVFLNDVYDQLGFERSTPGSVVGWVRDGEGDGYIDFGIYEDLNCLADADPNEPLHPFLLDFNVDGVIYELIERN